MGSQTYDYINRISDEVESDVELNTWYPNLKHKISASESIIELGYNNYILTLLEPLKASDIEEL